LVGEFLHDLPFSIPDLVAVPKLVKVRLGVKAAGSCPGETISCAFDLASVRD
jgi:hypothetical protein